MSEFPKNSIDNQHSRRGSIAAILALCGALAGGCAAPIQNIETKDPEAQKDIKPEWVYGPKVFEEDGYLYTVGSYDFLSKEDDSSRRTWAEMDATKTIATILFGQTRVNTDDGTESLYTEGTVSGMRYLEYHTEYNSDGTGVQYVLVMVKK